MQIQGRTGFHVKATRETSRRKLCPAHYFPRTVIIAATFDYENLEGEEVVGSSPALEENGRKGGKRRGDTTSKR